MIHVLGKYGIEVSDKCYAAGKIGKQKITDKNTKITTEVDCIQNPAYCTSFQSALKAIRKRMQMDALKNIDGDLEAAVNVIRTLDERFEKMIERIKF